MTERDDPGQRPGGRGEAAGGGYGTQRLVAGAPAGSSVVDAPPRDAGSTHQAQDESPASGSRPATVGRSRTRGAGSGGRGPRRARLTLRRIDPWSAMKFSLVLSVVLFIIWVVVVALLYALLAAMGVFSKLNESIVQLTGSSSAGIESVISAKTVLSSAVVVGLVDIVLFTALATLGAVIYNLCADLVGGVEVTLADGD